jgi:hypothetical protein
VLVDAERRQRRPQLDGPGAGEPVRRPALRVAGAELAQRGGHADHPVAGRARRRHQAAGQIDLVVGVRPDAQHGAEVHALTS